MSGNGASRVMGFDRNPWAVDEARWTYRFFGLQGRRVWATPLAFPRVRQTRESSPHTC